MRKLLHYIVSLSPLGKIIRETSATQTPVTFRGWALQRLSSFNRSVYWPVHFTSVVTNSRNIYAGIDVSPGYSAGCYIQGIGKIYIDDYTQIGPNVGIISANHDVGDNRCHVASSVRIGKYCWIGMNSVVLPGVVLGDFTIVGAGSIVTKSFEGGFCVIGGNPAKCLRPLDPTKCVRFENSYKYNGYIKSCDFQEFRKKHLDV